MSPRETAKFWIKLALTEEVDLETVPKTESEYNALEKAFLEIESDEAAAVLLKCMMRYCVLYVRALTPCKVDSHEL